MKVAAPVKPVNPPASGSKETPKRRTKSKMGCRTCKTRRVKCDERKPACQRCISTGRVCDGYGIWGGGGNAYGSAERAVNTLMSQMDRKVPSGSKALNAKTPAALPGLNQQEYLAFDFFRTRTATKIPGVFGSDFWDTLVLQLSIGEPAVLHAVVALAATHRRAIALGHARRPSLSSNANIAHMDSDEILALQQFNKAVAHLRFKKKDKQSLRVTLVVCIVFTCIELTKGEIGPSQAHFQSGLKLLQEIQPEGFNAAPTIQPQSESVDERLAEAFIRLNIHSSIMGEGPDRTRMTTAHNMPSMEYSAPLLFDSVSLARRHLDRLTQEIHGLSAEARRLALSCDDLPNRLVLDQQRLQRSAESWLHTFLLSLPRMEASEPEGQESQRVTLGVPLLLLHHSMISIMVATCLRRGDETVFDSHTAGFEAIMQQAINLWSKIARYMPFTLPTGKPDHLSFTVDMGFIPPLYFTAFRCRVPRLRRLAIQLLVSAPHREGIWDGVVTAAIARRIMEMEEGDFYTNADIRFAELSPFSESIIEPSLPPDDVPHVPNANRINYVNVMLPERGTGDNVLLVCKQYRQAENEEKGEWKSTTVELDVTACTPDGRGMHCIECSW
ncbi:hypothetical protein B0T14DRAFT_439375 [Immersiella caudata]|uniref:Zn(2)-C6 fungal-type domain-containing protein n=1 Tax=Immersiella caudata TaxID=314043 RepID=A0AA39W4C8_9PEZI|nr:hypothetical protein B0T14DRAFT_439375 [Immersiella caudata]